MKTNRLALSVGTILGVSLLLTGYFVQHRWRISSAIANLKDEDPVVRAQAAATLGHIGPGDEIVVEALFEVLSHEKYPSPAAADALVDIGPEVIPHLIHALKDEDARLRHWGTVPEPDESGWRIPSLFRALSELRSDPAVAAALNEAFQDMDRHVRICAALALDGQCARGTLGIREVSIPPGPEVSREERLRHWMTHLQHADPLVRAWAAVNLGEMNLAAREAAPALRRALKDEDAIVRSVASWALKRVDWSDEDAAEVLRERREE